MPGTATDAIRAVARMLESLELREVLARVARGAAEIAGAEVAAVWWGDGAEGHAVTAVHGLPPEAVGRRLVPGEGVAGLVVQRDAPVLVDAPAAFGPPFPDAGLACALGAPLRWVGAVRGVVAVGMAEPPAAADAELALLEAFADLAAVACRNSAEHAGLAQAARTDGLTGCLNHAALHEAIRREIERSRRADGSLALILLDLDDFKHVNERHGHLVGDELLRRVGHALQGGLRPYDQVGRYGGDEFAIVAPDAGEAEASEVANRAIARLEAVGADFEGEWPLDPARGCATAGVAEWAGSMGPAELVAQADRALLFGKQEEGPGRVVAASALPETFRPGRFRPRDEVPPRERGAGAAPAWSGPEPAEVERLRKRARRLAQAHALGTRLAALTGEREILDAAATELADVLGAERSALVPAAEAGEGLAGRCLGERQAILGEDARELCAPVVVGGEPWGAVVAGHAEAGAFDEDDARFAQAVADHVGTALQWVRRLAGPSASG